MAVPSALVSQTPPTGDRANAVVAGTFTAAAAGVQPVANPAAISPLFAFWGPFNLLLYGSAGPNGPWNGTVQLERSLDGGINFVVCGIGGAGQQAVWNTANQDVSVIVAEPELGVCYRLRCTAFVLGPINYRLSGNGGAAMSLANPSPT